MNRIKIQRPRPQTTLPRHEQEARRTRLKTERPAASRTPRRSRTPQTIETRDFASKFPGMNILET